MRNTWASSAALLATIGCVPPGPAVQPIESPIVAGTLDSGDPAMMEFLAIQGTSLSKCTATLVSPHVLLTAAHCIFETQGARYRVFPGGDDRNITARDLLTVASGAFDPAYNNSNPALGHDIGVVVLAAPLTAKPIPINRVTLGTGAVGKAARYIGYGLTDGVTQTGDGIKREATAPIAQIGRALIRIGANPQGTCNGDSGGPLLLDTGAGETIVGVVSFGDDMTCRTNSFFQRLDTQVAWVDEQIAMYDPGSVPGDAGGEPAGDAAAQPAKADAGAARDTVAADTAPAPPLPADAVAPSPPDAEPATGAAAALPDAASPTPPRPMAVHPQELTGGCACRLGGDRRPGPLAAVASLAVALAVRRRRRRR
jgi:MYXO-CTERM domain-containing protein